MERTSRSCSTRAGKRGLARGLGREQMSGTRGFVDQSQAGHILNLLRSVVISE